VDRLSHSACLADWKTCHVTMQAKKFVDNLSELELKGKMVLTCCGLNVFLNADPEIMNGMCITSSIPTIKYPCE